MDEELLRQTIARNMIHYRKLLKMTQSELAEKINYSDKSVSKWERAEGMPDVYILYRIAECFGVSVNDMLSQDSLRKPKSSRRKKAYVPILSVGLVFFVAAVVFFILKIALPELTWTYRLFIYAIPVAFIVAIVFAAIWWNKLSRFICVSGLIWSFCFSIHISFSIPNMYLIYLVAGIFELLTIFWYMYHIEEGLKKKNDIDK